MDDNRPRNTVILENNRNIDPYDDIQGGDGGLSPPKVRALVREFFRNFRCGNVYIYRDALVRNWNRHEYYIEIDLAHLNEFSEELFNIMQTKPAEYLPSFELGAKEALKLFLSSTNANIVQDVPQFQVMLKSSQLPQSLRHLTSEHLNGLVKVPGIIISCGKVQSKVISMKLKCSDADKCPAGDIPPEQVNSAIGTINIPQKCKHKECKGTYIIMGDECKFIDQQDLKLQESPEEVPTGEMPRSMRLVFNRYLVDRVSPGTRLSVIGVFTLFGGKGKGNSASNNGMSAGTRIPYIQVLGIQIDTESSGRTNSTFTTSEEERYQEMARDPDIYDKLSRSIAPQISGEYTVDIKKAIACLLMGGSRKVLPDGVRLRGDINVLLMGDPSTAKSQFLKFVERVSPIGVYTSGKGSSAAGLTASVIKDAKGEFYLEGGAMVLADGGVICIDEFDKMRENDRVAIHEAMEQQTISIAKAGITTVLNSRTSVLAAANPIYGRYDDLKGVGENIDLMSTILSRFDCIFIVRDVRDQERDRSIARHVLGVHINASMVDSNTSVDIDASTMKKFITYCRERCAPRLNDEAATLLSGHYVHIRNRVRESLKENPGESQVVPITIRQLEALVRLSESLAKMRLSAEASVADVEEAIRLFKVSTIAASQSNPALMSVQGTNASEEVKRAEEFLKRRMGLKMSVNTKSVVEEAQLQGFSIDSVKRAIAAMVMRNEVEERNQHKQLRRIR